MGYFYYANLFLKFSNDSIFIHYPIYFFVLIEDRWEN